MEVVEEIPKIYVFADESGSITKSNISNNRYFVIAMLFTDAPVSVRRVFRKEISQLMRKNDKYKDAIHLKKEIKAQQISETTKFPIYEALIKKVSQNVEIGIIVLDNNYTSDKFIENHARTFNYMLQVFLNSCFRNHSAFMKGEGIIEFVIDEQNIATGAKYNLEEYLNQQLTLVEPVCSEFKVSYSDSKNEKLVQLADFIANTFYRNIEKKNEESRENVALLKNILCSGDVFDFSAAHDIKLNLPTQSD